MKAFIFHLFICSLFFITGCKKEGSGFGFNLKLEEEFVVNNGSPINLPFNLLLPDLETNSQTHFENNNTRADYVTEIKLTQLDLNIVDPPNQDFSFLKEIEIFISADGLDETRLAFKKNIQNSEKSLSLETEKTDFTEYIKQDQYSLRVRTVVKSTFNNSIKLKADILFRVRARLARS